MVIERINYFRYREKFKMSGQEFALEPLEDIHEAFLIWSLDSERDKLETERQKAA